MSTQFTLEQLGDLEYLMGRMAEFDSKPSLSCSEQRQSDMLLAQISLVKSGVSLTEMRKQQYGVYDGRMTAKERRIAAGFKAFFESRVAETGVPVNPIASNTGNMGAFVPVDFFYDVIAAQKAVDPLLSEDDVTYIETLRGNPMQVPLLGDTENVATIIGENTNGSTAPDLSKPSAVVLGAYSFRTPVLPVTIEAMQDVQLNGGIVKQFQQFIADRIARGVSELLLVGSGIGQPEGLLTALAAQGVSPIIAQGAAKNDGGAETGANSIGSQDIESLVLAVDAAYRKSPKTAFIMNDNTRLALNKVVDKNGQPIIRLQGSQETMLGYPVKVSPSMPSLAASANTIIFGDFSYWATRCAMNGSRIMIYREAPGLVENGLVGLQFFARYDGALLWNDHGSPCPFAVLQQHS